MKKKPRYGKIHPKQIDFLEAQREWAAELTDDDAQRVELYLSLIQNTKGEGLDDAPPPLLH